MSRKDQTGVTHSMFDAARSFVRAACSVAIAPLIVVIAYPASAQMKTDLRVDLSMDKKRCTAGFPPLLGMSVPSDLRDFFRGWQNKGTPVVIGFGSRVPKQCAVIAATVAREAGFRSVSVDGNHQRHSLPPW